MKRRYLLIQNSWTGVIHVIPQLEYIGMKKCTTPCGYYVTEHERYNNPDLTKKSKVCSKCHHILLKYNKNLIAHVSYIKLKGEVYGCVTI